MYTIEPKRITTLTAVITLDELQIAATIADPDPLLADLRSLLKQWQTPQPKVRRNGQHPAAHRAAPKKNTRRVKQSTTLACQHCGKIFKQAGWHQRHEAACEKKDEIGAYHPAQPLDD